MNFNNIFKLILVVSIFSLFSIVFIKPSFSTAWNFGGAAGATATPSPGLIAASVTIAPTPTSTAAIPMPTPAADGDCMVILQCDYHTQYTTTNMVLNSFGSYNSATDPNPNASGTFDMFWAGYNFYGGNTQYAYASTHTITASDISNGYLGVGTAVQAGDRLGYAIFRHVSCGHWDAVGASQNDGNTPNTAPRPLSITTGSAGDLIVSLACTNNITTYTPPAGMTNAFSGDAGDYLDYTVQSSAGAFRPSAGIYGSSVTSGQMQAAMRNLGGTQ